MNFYVFRIAKGYDGGTPTNQCPMDMKNLESEIKAELSNIDEDIIPYESNNYTGYLHKELWQCGKLRQGWGIEGLDLRIINNPDEKQWIKNYILGAKKYWGANITKDYCHIAMGRLNILRHMLDFKNGDIVFIPKHSFNKHHDKKCFTVCKVVGEYYFDLDPKYNDFGHVVIVKDIKSYMYSKGTLLAYDFIGYRKAIGKIEKYHQLYNEDRFKNFLENNYSIVLR